MYDISFTTKTETTLAKSTVTASDFLSALIECRLNWESGSLHKSNEELYQLLGKCLKVYELMAQATDEGEMLRKGLDDYVKHAKLRFDGNTHTVCKIVRVVFDNDRRRSSQYGLVLLAALRRDIKYDKLTEFIRAAGGIDKVRAGGNSTGEKVEDKANKVWSSIKTTILANVSSTELTKASDLANIDKRVVLLATQKVGGAYEVHAVVKDSNAVDAVFASQLSTVTKAAANVTAETQAADQAKVLDDAKKALINAMLG